MFKTFALHVESKAETQKISKNRAKITYEKKNNRKRNLLSYNIKKSCLVRLVTLNRQMQLHPKLKKNCK